MKISILGTFYEIIRMDYNDDPDFEKLHITGYCDGYTKKIVVGNMKTFPQWESEKDDVLIQEAEKETLRHEIVHAFLDESGLSDCSMRSDIPWAKNEEMVDWIAIQGDKIYKAWIRARAI